MAQLKQAPAEDSTDSDGLSEAPRPNGPSAGRPGPEIVIGLVAPLGADLDKVEELLTNALLEVKYDAKPVHLADELVRAFADLRQSETAVERGAAPADAMADEVATQTSNYEAKMELGTRLCRRTGRKDAMAQLAISMISRTRDEANDRKIPSQVAHRESNLRSPLPRTAFIVRQLKRPEEVLRLRQVYEGRFRLVGVWQARDERIQRLARRLGGNMEAMDLDRYRPKAERLIERDDRELTSQLLTDPFGQNVRDTFPLADVFVSPASSEIEGELQRFVRALFGHPAITPRRDELAMYLAAAAALRSGSLARQVGAAILNTDGDVVTIGCNEVPKPKGGMYWVDDAEDDRDITRGEDSSDMYRHSLVADALDKLKSAGWLESGHSQHSREELSNEALKKPGGPLRSAKVMDILEFIRAMHAEQAAIVDAARLGACVKNGILYVTTFPCHECARLILGAGIGKVVYIEPYAKSRAVELYPKGISLDPSSHPTRVTFEPFLGIAPTFFRTVFQWSESRKGDTGKLRAWEPASATPRFVSPYPGHIVAEYLDYEEFQERLIDAGLVRRPNLAQKKQRSARKRTSESPRRRPRTRK